MGLARTPLAAAAALALAACGGSPATRNVEEPFTGWLDVAGMRCGDGSPSGIGILPGRSDAVLVYLAPGGACWGTAPCDLREVPNRFGLAEFTSVQAVASGTIFDRALPGNPFDRWTYVFIPYCTGDVHAGATFRDHGGQRWEHRGFANLQAAVAAAAETLPRPRQLVVAGSSAGGFGALAAYELVREVWDPEGGTTSALLDDSGPTFVGTAIPAALLSTWWDAWGLGSTIGSSCPGCATDLSALWDGLHARYPEDRLALVSTTQDATMRTFFADATLAIPAKSPMEFEGNLAVLAQKLGALGPAVASYRLGGADAHRHAILADAFLLGSSGGPPALDWLTAMVLDPSWSSSTSP